MLSAVLMFERFAKALKVAAREEGFVRILGTAILLVMVGTVTYTLTQDWSLVDGFYFAVATLTTSSIADPELVIMDGAIKIFTVFYVWSASASWSSSLDKSASATSRSDEKRKRRRAARPTQTTPSTVTHRAKPSGRFGDNRYSVVTPCQHRAHAPG